MANENVEKIKHKALIKVDTKNLNAIGDDQI